MQHVWLLAHWPVFGLLLLVRLLLLALLLPLEVFSFGLELERFPRVRVLQVVRLLLLLLLAALGASL